MYFIRANTCSPVVATVGAHRFPDWVSGSNYPAGVSVRDAVADADFYSRTYIYGRTTRPGLEYWYYWNRLNADGDAETQPSSYAATFGRLGGTGPSLYDAWAVGAELLQGQRVFDTVTQRDYEALVPVPAGSNYVRPSTAVVSLDVSVAGRFLDLGPASLFALFDDDVSTIATAETTAYVTFDVDGIATIEATDCVAIVGLRNIATVTVYGLNPSTSAVINTTVYDLKYSPATDQLKDMVVHPLTATDSPRFKIQFDALTGSPYQTIEIGKIVAGKKITYGTTVENVNTSIVDYSAKVIDPDFGTYRFIKRGFSKIVSAQLMVEHASGDQFNQYIEQARAVPTFWDFNNTGQSLARVRVFGFYKTYGCVVQGIPWDTYTLEISGLAEQ